MSEQRTGAKRKPFTLQLGKDDQDISDYLDSLEYGRKQGEVKAAIRARMGLHIEHDEPDTDRLARIEQALIDLPKQLDARFAQRGNGAPITDDEPGQDEVDPGYIANIVKARRPGLRSTE